jgi:hypothetical protein
MILPRSREISRQLGKDLNMKSIEDVIIEAMNTIVDEDGDITPETIREEIAPRTCTDKEMKDAMKLYFS